MPFNTHVPPTALSPFVADAVGYGVPANPSGLHRGLPSRHLTLVIELRAPLRVAGLGRTVAAHGVVGGLHTAPALIDASAPQEGLHYALSPLAASALLGAPAAELQGMAVDLEDVLGRSARGLVERIADAKSWEQRFSVVDAFLIQRLGTRPTVADEVVEAWRLIFAAEGRVSVAGVAEHVGWSRRHLSERFRIVTGLTPKQAARIARFEVARGMLASREQPSLAQLAVECGYADQPHLAREWKSLAGCSVATWLREELPFVQDNGT
ncbi:MAG: helix-turn-helix domain-containing protein [Egibacteraceae bacterium]